MDIVERLRQPVMLHSNPEQTNAERREAAAKIEQLRAWQRARLETDDLARAENERLRAALKPFADLLETRCNGYESSPDQEVVRSVGTIGRDYAFITVGDLRKARDALRNEQKVPAPKQRSGT